jgi:hypothetical protein
MTQIVKSKIYKLERELIELRERLEGIERDDEYVAVRSRAVELNKEIRNLEELLK